MTTQPGIIALMGSGELTATMVEVHKSLIKTMGPDARAFFIDTPAGFQLNVDQISRKAVDYFNDKIGYPLSIASYKTIEALRDGSADQAHAAVAQADYILLGPGSPTYALKQLRPSPFPDLFTQRIASGACLVAASAAALALGRWTLPVYEIYKCGESPHWVEGLDLLGRFGLNLTVVPHWNNAEGGSHDTSRCFMGVTRFHRLEETISSSTDILGLDEHTALIIDLGQSEATVKGIGKVVLRRRGEEYCFSKNDRIPWEWLRQRETEHSPARKPGEEKAPAEHRSDTEETASMQIRYNTDPLANYRAHIAPVVESILQRRKTAREQGQWDLADMLRECLAQAGVAVVDNPKGTTWYTTLK
jgi:peptidase E